MYNQKLNGKVKFFISLMLLAFVVTCGIVFAGCGQTPSNGTIKTEEGKSTLYIPEHYNYGVIPEDAYRGADIDVVKLPSNLISIGKSAFEGCTDLIEVVIDGKSHRIIFNNKINGFKDAEIKENAFKDTKILSIDVLNSSDNDTLCEATIKNIPYDVSKVVITAYLNKTTDIGFKNEIDVAGLREKTVTLDFGTYGLFENIVVETYNSQDEVLSEESYGGVAVTASHYNFGYLNGSYPVLVYSLKLKEIAETGPTFTFLERSATYNWDNLPYGTQCLPFITKQQATSGAFHDYRTALGDYIKTLYGLNNESTFSAYITDNSAELILDFFVATQIPETNWSAYMLSDGRSTAGWLNSAYNVETPSVKHNKLMDEWLKVKNYTYANGYNSEVLESKLSESIGWANMLAKYTYAINSVQDNVFWWVNRLRASENLVAINNRDSVFANAIIASATQLYTNNLLSALSPEDSEAFKALYKFSDDMFSVAREEGKKIMVILGGSWKVESASFYNYVRLTMEFYGDEYVYYYKGHPGYPTALYEGRQQALAELADEGFTIYELDNAIAAEVIMFFNPDIYLAGWQSTTFKAVENSAMACALFDIAKQESYSGDLNTYAKLMDMFITKMANEISSYEGIVLDETHTYYLIQFNNQAAYENQVENYAKHEIAIFDATSKTLTYYHKGEGANYSVVDKNGNVI